MLIRVFVVAMNAYREAVRARLLLGLFGLAIATSIYSVLVASLSIHQEARVVSDIGAASISIYAAVVSIVIGATSLHRELEQKTIFPILARPLRRHEYLVGKYLGALATLFVFIAVDAALVLAILALETGQKPALVLGTMGLLVVIGGVLLASARYTRVFVALPWSLATLLAMALLASTAGDDRRLMIASLLLTLAETSIVISVATLFSSFSSPFLTAVLSFMMFVVGRSADTLAHLSAKLLGGGSVGEAMHTVAGVLARVVPNLHLYVPPRPVLLGQVAEVPIWPYVATSALHAVGYSAVLLALAALAFRRRDFA